MTSRTVAWRPAPRSMTSPTVTGRPLLTYGFVSTLRVGSSTVTLYLQIGGSALVGSGSGAGTGVGWERERRNQANSFRSHRIIWRSESTPSAGGYSQSCDGYPSSYGARIDRRLRISA